MLDLFRYEDDDRDELIIRPSTITPGSLVFQCDRNGARRSARVPREKVELLYAILGEWLYPVHTPEGPNRSLIEQMIQRNVREQVAAVLPLHLKTIATREALARQRGCDCVEEESDLEPVEPYVRPIHMTTEAECDLPRCTSLHLSDQPQPTPDPEPHDVGHPEEETPSKFERPLSVEAQGRLMAELLPRRVPSCIDCLHGWGEHTGGICWGSTGADGIKDPNGCRCTREAPESVELRKQIQEAAAPPPCADCGHDYDRHRPVCSSVRTSDRPMVCRCKRYRSTS